MRQGANRRQRDRQGQRQSQRETATKRDRTSNPSNIIQDLGWAGREQETERQTEIETETNRGIFD